MAEQMSEVRPLKYRKKPVWVEAVRVGELTMSEVARWCGGRAESEAKASDHTDVARWVTVPTIQPTKLRARIGDYIVKDDLGQFSVWKPEIFEVTFERPTRGGSYDPGSAQAPAFRRGVNSQNG